MRNWQKSAKGHFDVYRYQNLIQLGRNAELTELALSDYNTYSGMTLEGYFRQKMAESGRYSQIGSWWQGKGGAEASEIDIVAISLDGKAATVAEVKRQQRNYDHKLFMSKIDRLKSTALLGYEITPRLLTLADM